MQLARNHFIISILSAFLYGCAQLGTIEGGPKDVTAPNILESSTQNGSTNFNQGFIEWQFDEYFQLNSPQTTLTLTPKHSRLKTSNIGKKVRVEFMDSLQANTTYQLMFNGTVKDINEGNDSLMIFVFSTGPILDSAYYESAVIDAFTSQPIKKVFVGLFDPNDKEPKYLQKSNEQGKVKFAFIKPGTYSVLSWEDQNSNGTYDSIERVAFRLGELIINDSIIDSLPLRLAKPEFNKVIRDAIIITPGIVSVCLTNFQDEKQHLILDGLKLREDQLFSKSQDSVLLSYNSSSKTPSRVYLEENEILIDSFKINSATDELTSLKLKGLKNWLKNNQSIQFSITDFIDKIDVKKILVRDKSNKDTLLIEEIKPNGNELELYLAKHQAKEVEVIFDKDAVIGKTGLKTDRFIYSLVVLSERELGVLQVNVEKLNSYDVVELLANNKIIERQKRGENKQLNFKDLQPGDYTFRVIEDENNNWRWDGWRILNKLEPEKVSWFSQPVKVRANWEIKTELNPKNE